MLQDQITQYAPAATALNGKTILVTGAAGALGSALAMRAATLGCELILLDKNERALNKVYDDIEAQTGALPGLYPLDLAGATVDDYEQLSQTVENEFGRLTGLVHCAANIGQLAPFLQTDAAEWQKCFTTNLHGPVFLTSALLPLMQSSAGVSSIIFTLDNKRRAYWASYTAAKAALHAVMDSLADELDGDRDDANQLRVRCNAVNPVKMRSMLRSSAYPGEDPLTVPTAQNKLQTYLFLLSDESAGINGQIVEASSESETT